MPLAPPRVRQPLQQRLPLEDVADSVVAGLALDTQRAGVADGGERLQELPGADLTDAEGHLIAPFHARLC